MHNGRPPRIISPTIFLARPPPRKEKIILLRIEKSGSKFTRLWKTAGLDDQCSPFLLFLLIERGRKGKLEGEWGGRKNGKNMHLWNNGGLKFYSGGSVKNGLVGIESLYIIFVECRGGGK